jgi:hypothetical protein
LSFSVRLLWVPASLQWRFTLIKVASHFKSRRCGMRNLQIRLKPVTFVFFYSLVMDFCFIAMALYRNHGCQSAQVPHLRDEESGGEALL